MTNIPDWLWKILSLAVIPAFGWGLTLQVKVERLESRLEVMDLDNALEKVSENHTQLAVHTVKLQSIDEKLDDLKDLLRSR